MREKLDKILKEYIKKFEKKQNLNFDFAVSEDLMGVICFSDSYFINITDVVYDIDTDQSKGLILEWIEYYVDGNNINYYSYSKGLRL